MFKKKGGKKFCPKCGSELKFEDKYCIKCGYSFEQRKKKLNIRNIIIAIIIIIIIWIGIRLWQGQDLIPSIPWPISNLSNSTTG